MPELPEVETIKLGLQKKIVGLTIKDIEIRSPKSFIGQAQQINNKPFGNAQGLRGRKILAVWRRAKILGIDLDGGLTLLFHLKMTGQLVYDDGQRLVGGHPTPDMRDQMPNSHTRVIFEFSNGSKLYFNDQRKFGWVKIVESGKLSSKGGSALGGKDESFLKGLGPEPLEKGFTWQVFKSNLLKHQSMPVKVAMMDQSVVSGVGNIYANEACFDAGIDPRTKVSQMSDEQFKRLHVGIIKSLKDGIKYGGATRAHFVDAEGHKGYFLDYAFVYGLDKKACKKCKTVIKKISLGGRGTYFCPKCQK